MRIPGPWPGSWGRIHKGAHERARGSARRSLGSPGVTPQDRGGILPVLRVLVAFRVARSRSGAISGAMTQAVASNAFPAPEHDHDLCLQEAMERARKAFEAKGLRLTPLRQAV